MIRTSPAHHAASARAATATTTAARAALRATLTVALAIALLPVAPQTSSASTWTVDTTQRTEADIRYVWSAHMPTHTGSPYAVTPSTSAPYAPGQAAPSFIADGLNTINFARYLAGLPYDVTTTWALNQEAQHGAVLMAASTFSHTPPKPADMTQAFYDIGFRSTTTSNIGRGHTSAASFQMGCLADRGPTNLPHVGHRRWLLNPPMAQTGIGIAHNATGSFSATYAFDRSRSGAVDYDTILWPAEGLFPVEFICPQTPWSITLNPAKYDWNTAGPHTVTLRRISDGRTWTFNDTTKNTSGTYFNADFRGFGIANAFIFRPDPATVSYQPGDVYEVTLSGGIYAKGTQTPRTVTYRTTFMTLDGPIEWPDGLTVREIAGTDRVATAIEASKLAYPDGADTVVIATAFDWPDALGGAALAGALDAPILLTSPSSLPGAVNAEIKRLDASRAVILGGTRAVAPAIQTTLANTLGGADRVTRIAGNDRYDTARRVAAETVAVLEVSPCGYSGTAFVATGANFPDALGASPLAAANGWPIYLVGPSGLDGATVGAMDAASVTRTLVLGGTSAVPQAVVTGLSTEVGATTQRLSGSDRYATAHRVATFGVDEGGLCWNRVALATGDSFPDALAGGVLQGGCGSVVLLTPSRSLHSSVQGALAANRDTITEIRFLGGENALSRYVRETVALTLKK